VCLGGDRGRSLAAHEVAHLTDAITSSEHTEFLAPFVDRHFALDDDVEGIVDLTLDDNVLAPFGGDPSAGTGQLPQFRITETLKELEAFDAGSSCSIFSAASSSRRSNALLRSVARSAAVA